MHLTEKATEAGVDGVLVVTPYYNKPNRRGLRAHFEAVAGATNLPVVLYNIPGRCVIDLPNEFLRELAQAIPNVVAVKQARTEDIEAIDGMDLLAGNDDKLAEVLDKGGTGGICVASHIVGREMRRMIDEPDQRQEIHDVAGGHLRRDVHHREPHPGEGGAEHARHARPARCGCRWLRRRRRRSRRSAACSSATGS